MRKPKILILGSIPPPYTEAAITTAMLLKSGLNREYTLLHAQTGRNKIKKVWKALSWKQIRENVQVCRRLSKLIRAEHPDLILMPISESTFDFLRESVYIIICKLLGQRVLLHLHGSDFRNWIHRVQPTIRQYAETVLNLVEGVIVQGDNLKYLFADYLPENQVFVVPNGATYPVTEFEERTTSGITRFLHVADLEATRGIVDIVHAAALLKEQGQTSFYLDVVGAWKDADTEKECKRIVAEHGLPIFFHGQAHGDERMLFLRQADALVYTPRLPEGHPWILVEAMASELPIIATDRGAIVESVQHGENGYIVPAQQPQHIAAAMDRLISRPALRQQFAQASYHQYQLQFTEKSMVKRMDHVFRTVLRISELPQEVINEEVY